MSPAATAAGILEGFGLVVYECDRATGQMSWLAPAAARVLLGREAAAIDKLAHWVDGVVHPGDRDRVARIVEHSLRAAVDHHLEYRIVRADDRVVDVADTARIDRERGVLQGLLVDVTHRRRAEHELRQSESRLDEAQRLAGLGHWDWDIHGNRLDWSSEIYRIFGLDPGEFAATYEAFLERVHIDDRSAVDDAVARALAGSETYSLEHRIVRPDGTIGFVHERALVTFDERGKPQRMLGTVQDVSDRHRAEQALRDSEERFRQIADNIDVGLWIATPDGSRVLYVSPGVERIWRRDRAEFVANPRLFVDLVHEDDRASVEPLYAPDGAQRECRIVCDDGEVRWIRMRVFPVRDANGAVYRAAAIAEDVTEEHLANAAMSRARDEIQRSLAEKSVLLREIHHRVKNNLQVVSSLLYLQSATVVDPTVRRMFDESRNRILTMAYIHETLYQSDDLNRVDFGSYIRKLVGGIAASYAALAPNVAIDADIDPTHLDLDAAVPCGLLVNELVTNALKYGFPDGRAGRVRVTFRRVDDGHELIVSDDGVGLPESANEAPSLGLKLVRTLAEQLRASVRIERSAGTTFCVRLPACQRA